MKRETPLALYKGLGAVLSGIVPKMAIRFASFEAYKGWLADKDTKKTSVGGIFIGVFIDFYESIKRKFTVPLYSWFRCRDHRSSCSCNTNGGRKDPTSGATTLIS